MGENGTILKENTIKKNKKRLISLVTTTHQVRRQKKEYIYSNYTALKQSLLSHITNYCMINRKKKMLLMLLNGNELAMGALIEDHTR